MSAPPSLKAIDTTQMEDAPEWFREAFLSQLNPFLRDVSASLSGGLTPRDNLLSEERDVRVNMPSGSGSPDSAPYPLFLTPQRAKAPRNMVVTAVRVESSTTAAPSSGVWPFWDMTSDGRIRIRWFSGLDASTTYTVRVRFD